VPQGVRVRVSPPVQQKALRFRGAFFICQILNLQGRDEKPVLSEVEGSLGVYPERACLKAGRVEGPVQQKALRFRGAFFICQILNLQGRDEKPVLSEVEGSLGVYPERACLKAGRVEGPVQQKALRFRGAFFMIFLFTFFNSGFDYHLFYLIR